MNYIRALDVEGKTFNYRTNEQLPEALELKLFEDQKDSIKLKSLKVSSVVDKDTQERSTIWSKQRMIKNYGYCEICSTERAELRGVDLCTRRYQGLIELRSLGFARDDTSADRVRVSTYARNRGRGTASGENRTGGVLFVRPGPEAQHGSEDHNREGRTRS